MPKEISLVILIETKPGCAHEQVHAFRKLQPLVLAEKGCLHYELNSVVGEENKFLLIEKLNVVFKFLNRFFFRL